MDTILNYWLRCGHVQDYSRDNPRSTTSYPLHAPGELPGRLVRTPVARMFCLFSHFLSRVLSDEEAGEFCCHERTGRPLDTESFIARLENVLGRILHRHKPGSKGASKEK